MSSTAANEAEAYLNVVDVHSSTGVASLPPVAWTGKLARWRLGIYKSEKAK